MKTILNRIETIEKQITSKMGFDYNSMLKIEKWIFDLGPKDSVTLQEWSAYKERELKHSGDVEKTTKELNELEQKIRSNDGFMELIFYGNDGRVMGHIF